MYLRQANHIVSPQLESLFHVQTTAPITEKKTIALASVIHLSCRSFPSTLFSITMKHPNGIMNAIRNAKLDPTRDQMVATPDTRVAAKKQAVTISRVLL
jgi:hypothetical protein